MGLHQCTNKMLVNIGMCLGDQIADNVCVSTLAVLCSVSVLCQ